jgi:hypothetical protein
MAVHLALHACGVQRLSCHAIQMLNLAGMQVGTYVLISVLYFFIM